MNNKFPLTAKLATSEESTEKLTEILTHADKDGFTPLHTGSKTGHSEIIEGTFKLLKNKVVTETHRSPFASAQSEPNSSSPSTTPSATSLTGGTPKLTLSSNQ